MNHMTISLSATDGEPLALISGQGTNTGPLRRPQSWTDISRLAKEFDVEVKDIDWMADATDWMEKTCGKKPDYLIPRES